MQKMYRVVPIALSGINKKIFKANDIVTEKDFPAGNVPELIAKGALVEVTSRSVTDVTPEKQEEPATGSMETTIVDDALKQTEPETVAPPVQEPEKEKEEPPAPVTVQHTITQTDLDNNPQLVEQGAAVGDVVDLPQEEHLEMVREHYETFGLPTLREMCTERSIEFAANAGKKKLVDLLMANIGA